MKCNICNKEVVLFPSAKERAEKFGGTSKDYTRLFPTHAHCAIEKRNRDTIDLMRRIKS